ncbi:ankyrin repeat domain-containing protein SOWAHA-like [Silurus asotus]|uniref:Ankyrin repeat domain-containing protein SOWAHA-like n=1 Tax=Silurus asotus TaxID=30991 RepID=A0AAD5FKB9_SILAS|nr:ankyrin repeat domain-containing protein SOWAHA-like [Silurus asotus]
MEISQESILSLLLKKEGKMKNSELLGEFKGVLNCSDSAEKKQNRDLFKMIINNLAVVKEIEGVKTIVLRKKYQHLLKPRSDDGSEEMEEGGGETEGEELISAAEQTEDREVRENKADPEENKSEQKTPSDSAEFSESSPAPSFIQLALQRQTSTNIKVKKSLNFTTSLKLAPEDSQKHSALSVTETSAPRRYALPLRMPPVIITPAVDEQREKIDIPPNRNNPDKVHLAPLISTPGPPCSPRNKRHSSVDSVGISCAPQPRRQCKSAKPVDEPRYDSIVPLESSEHEWMVTSASGRWTSVYGLLLNDAQLAEKRDFISGFMALHWAAKCGNQEILCKIIDLSRKNGKGVDVNSRSYAGYTPLHLAAIHGQEYIIGILVNEYGANCNVRDNSGKKPHHYLDKAASHSIRELLGGVKVVQAEPQKNPEDTDTHKHTHTISRLFQPQTIGYKKKSKSRSTFSSVAEDVKEDKSEHLNPKHRVLSDVFS